MLLTILIGILLVTNHHIVQGFECIDGESDGHFERETLTRETDVFRSAAGSGMDCGTGNTITETYIARIPLKPSWKYGSSIALTNNARDAECHVRPVRNALYRCSNTGATHHAVAIYSAEHYTAEKECPKYHRVVVAEVIPVKSSDTFNAIKGCVGRRSCDVNILVPGATYEIQTDCRPNNYAMHCCDSAAAEDSELYRATSACGLKLECECCSRQNGDTTLGIRDCGTVKFAGATRNVIGINPDNGTPYDESNDHATDDRPDEDEDGCHVRKAVFTTALGEKKVICIPGNMARMLSIIDDKASSLGGKCVVRSIQDDKRCTNEILETRRYFYAVDLTLPADYSKLSVTNLKEKIRDMLEDEDIQSSVEAMKRETGSEMAEFIVAFGL